VIAASTIRVIVLMMEAAVTFETAVNFTTIHRARTYKTAIFQPTNSLIILAL
jgi:hypothetical protein